MRKNEATNLGSMPRLFANKVGDIAVSAGSWVYPPFYRIQCERLQNRTYEPLQREKRIVGGLGEIIIGASTGRFNVDRHDVIKLSEAIKPDLGGVGYHTEFDPHTAGVLEKVAPLAIDNNK